MAVSSHEAARLSLSDCHRPLSIGLVQGALSPVFFSFSFHPLSYSNDTWTHTPSEQPSEHDTSSSSCRQPSDDNHMFRQSEKVYPPTRGHRCSGIHTQSFRHQQPSFPQVHRSSGGTSSTISAVERYAGPLPRHGHRQMRETSASSSQQSCNVLDHPPASPCFTASRELQHSLPLHHSRCSTCWTIHPLHPASRHREGCDTLCHGITAAERRAGPPTRFTRAS
jgi:hypothetical protein